MWSALLAFLDRYPGLWSILGPMLAALVWAIVSGIFNSIYDRLSPHSDEEWARAMVLHPRWSAIVSVFKTAGLNVPGLLRSLRVFFGGPLPTPVAVVVAGAKPPTGQALRDAARLMAEEQLRLNATPPPLPPAIEVVPVTSELARTFPTPTEGSSR